MIEVLLWIVALVVVYIVGSLGLHFFRMKTNPFYRFRANEAEQDVQIRAALEQLRASKSPEVRELAEKLGARRTRVSVRRFHP